MRILIIGDYYSGLEAPDSARRATRALGAALARNGHELVVCTDNPDTADYEFACGALESDSHDFTLTVYSPAGVPYPFADIGGAGVRSVKYDVSPFESWEIMHMEVIEYADVIVLIGGAGEWRYVTKMLGLSAIALRKVVLPLASFGGETRHVWESMATSTMRESYRAMGIDLTRLNSPWREKDGADTIRAMAEVSYRNRAMIAAPTWLSRGRGLTGSLTTAFVLFAVTAGLWFWLLSTTLRADYPVALDPLFGLAVLAGGIGAATNSVYSLWRGDVLSYAAQSVSVLVGASGGLISFLLYLLGQLLFSGEVLTELPDGVTFMRNALVASFFGLFSGLFIDKGYEFIRRGSESIVGSLEPRGR